VEEESGSEASAQTLKRLCGLVWEHRIPAVFTEQNGSVSAAATGKWTLDVYVLRYTHDGKEDPTNWETLRHVDLLNPAAVRRFLDVTHEQYKLKLGDTFKNVEASSPTSPSWATAP
jgi:hypothetical protein